MTYLSVCSGIEAASVAWEPLGWKAIGFSEIEPFPCELLKQKFPNVKNYGDMTKYENWDIGQFDVLVGGTPCQSFSIAGTREGTKDPRGQLILDSITSKKLRRITPIECERLQGFPDNWTRIAWHGKSADQCPDVPRYKAIGNSMAVPVMRWIGNRIKNIEKSEIQK